MMTNPVKISMPEIKKVNQIMITAESRADFMSVSNQFFANFLAERIDVAKEVIHFQKNFMKKSFCVKLKSELAVSKVIQTQKVKIKGKNFTIQSSSDMSFWLTVHWANPDLPDEAIKKAISPYGKIISMFRPKYDSGPLKGVEMGTRRIKLDPVRKGRYVPNFITFNDETVMFTYPGMNPECRKCAQDTHKFQDCQAIYCDNCKGFSPHEHPHTTIDCPEPCRNCQSLDHSISWCRQRKSYASNLRSEPSRSEVSESEYESSMEGFAFETDPLHLNDTEYEAPVEKNMTKTREEDSVYHIDAEVPSPNGTDPTSEVLLEKETEDQVPEVMLEKAADGLVAEVLSGAVQQIHSEHKNGEHCDSSSESSFVTVVDIPVGNKFTVLEQLTDSEESTVEDQGDGGKMEVASKVDTSQASEKDISTVPEPPVSTTLSGTDELPPTRDTVPFLKKSKMAKPTVRTIVQKMKTIDDEIKHKERSKPY